MMCRFHAITFVFMFLARVLYADELQLWPPTSIYRLPELTLENQLGMQEKVSSWSGHPYLIGMFYGSCQMVCPVEIEAIKTFENKFHAWSHLWIAANLISFDSSHDQVDSLRREAEAHHLDASWYQLLRVKQGDLGYLAGVLGVTWRALPGGGFEHNAVVSLIDSQGRLVVQTTALELVHDAAFMQAVQTQLVSSRPGP